MLTFEVIFTTVEVMLHNFHNESHCFVCHSVVLYLKFSCLRASEIRLFKIMKVQIAFFFVFLFCLDETPLTSMFLRHHDVLELVILLTYTYKNQGLLVSQTCPCPCLEPIKLVELTKYVPEVRTQLISHAVLNTGFHHFVHFSGLIFMYIAALLVPPSSQGHYRNLEGNEFSV